MPITSMPQLRYKFDSASVENAGPSMHKYVPPSFAVTSAVGSRRACATCANCGANGMREADVRDQSFAEKRGDAAACAIDKLIRDHEIERLVFFLQRAHGAERENALHAQRLHAVNIGAEIQLRRRDPVPPPVPRQERDLFARQLADDVRRPRARPTASPSRALPALQIRASNTTRCRR